MRIIDILDRPLWCKDATAALHKAGDFEAGFTNDPDCLEMIIEELSTLNSCEISRFDGWTNKGTAMLGASGLILSLVPLGFPLVGLSYEFHTLAQFWAWFTQSTLYLFAIAGYFLATWNSLVSLRARPLCFLDEDEWRKGKQDNRDSFRRELAANKMATYKNNVEIVNLKATKVNEAWNYFFLACMAQIAFLLWSVARYIYFE